MPARFARLLRALAPLAGVLLLALATPALAQQPVSSGPLAQLEPARLELDQVEATLRREDLSVRVLNDLGQTVAALRQELRARIAEIEPRFAQVDVRLKQLGPPPAGGAPAEDAAITAERVRLAQAYSELDAALKQARLLAVRAEQLNDRITERRRAIYAEALFERGASALDPRFWVAVAQALPNDVRSMGIVLRSWGSFLEDNADLPRTAAALVSLVAFALAWHAVVRWARRRAAAVAQPETRLVQASAAVWAFLRAALAGPVAVAVVLAVVETFGLMPQRIDDIATALLAAIVVASFSRGIALALFAPDAPERRLVPLSARSAETIARHYVWAARGLALAIFLHLTHKALAAPPILIVGANAALAATVLALLVHLLYRLRPRGTDGATPLSRLLWIRTPAWVVAAAIAVALAAGYHAFAYFLAERLVAGVAVLGALYLLVRVVDALFTEPLSPDAAAGRAVLINLGIDPQRVGFIGVLFAGVIRLLLGLTALLLLLGPWQVTTSDFLEPVRSLALGVRIGEVSISLGAVTGALVILGVGLLATRGLRRWLETQLLPRTSLEASLQLSVATIAGYVGIIAIIALALAQLGIDLQKIAFIAGALSVGIGFGLQSIVSNFVSGLILLAERPIRVGDLIVVKGEEGKVRRISVRATEIETADQGSVIVPNSELITGLVKNWTHVTTWGRIVLKVGVAYDSDPDAVRDILMACTREHPQVVTSPEVSVQLAGLGENALIFEVYAVVLDLAKAGSIKSDIHFAVLRRFRAAGIRVAPPQREVRLLDGTPAAEPKPA
jgi:potassium-dependent mechanosensitive channel